MHKTLALAAVALGLALSRHSTAQGIAPPPAPAAATTRGAQMPFTTYEAEAPTCRVRGQRVAMGGLPRADDSTPAMEASGRAFVELAHTGDFVEFPAARAANALVLRHCTPDAPGGGGTTSTLSVYVNGKKRQTLALSSRHNWLYGEAGQNGQSNDPAKGQPHVFWDETRFFIQGGLRSGDTLRLQQDADNTAAFYRLDLVDLESVPPPLAPPPANTYLSVEAYGANGRDQQDDTVAIQQCLKAAHAQHKIAWFPPGTYYQSQKFVLDGGKVRGAGMWHTALVGTTEGSDWSGTIGFDLRGESPQVSDLMVDSQAHTARTEGGKPFTGAPDHWRIENVWITHTIIGVWLNGSNGIIRNCRVRDTYADSINLNINAHDNLVENNHVRGGGDDGIALLSEAEFKQPPAARNVVRHNTVSAIWWGHNCDVAGGSHHLIEDNLFEDNAKMGVFTLNLPGAFPMHPLTDTLIRRNTLLRGGGNYVWQKRGALWIFPDNAPVSNITFEDNDILDSVFRAVHFAGPKPQTITLRHNRIAGVGEDAIYFDTESSGVATLQDNTVSGVPPTGKPLVNASKGGLEVVQKGNSWQTPA